MYNGGEAEPPSGLLLAERDRQADLKLMDAEGKV